MNKGHRLQPIMLRVAISLLFGCIIFIASWFIAKNYSQGAYVQWKPLGKVPDDIETFTTAFFHQNEKYASVFVTTQNENVYRLSRSICRNDNHCWEDVTLAEKVEPNGNFIVDDECPITYSKMKAPPDIVVACAYFGDQAVGTHFIRDVYFVKLMDESILVWQFVPGMSAIAILIIGTLIGIMIVLISLYITRSKHNH